MSMAEPFSRLPDPYYHAEFYADVPFKRFVAWVVDTILIAMVTFLLVLFTAFTVIFFFPAIFVAVSFVYRFWSLASRSATPGMRLAAIEFRRHDGARFDALTAALHTLGFLLSSSMVFPQVISVILMATGARAQGLTDLALGTVAINRAAAS